MSLVYIFLGTDYGTRYVICPHNESIGPMNLVVIFHEHVSIFYLCVCVCVCVWGVRFLVEQTDICHIIFSELSEAPGLILCLVDIPKME